MNVKRGKVRLYIWECACIPPLKSNVFHSFCSLREGMSNQVQSSHAASKHMIRNRALPLVSVWLLFIVTISSQQLGHSHTMLRSCCLLFLGWWVTTRFHYTLHAHNTWVLPHVNHGYSCVPSWWLEIKCKLCVFYRLNIWIGIIGCSGGHTAVEVESAALNGRGTNMLCF